MSNKTLLTSIRGLGRAYLFLVVSAAFAFGQAAEKKISVENVPGSSKKDDAPVTLSPFEVKGDKDSGYRKSSTVTTSRVAVLTTENPQSVEILSGELLRDMQIALPKEAFRYTSSVLVGETEIGQAGLYTMRSFQLPIFYNGLALASSFSLTPIIPVDNLDRVEIAKGPVAMYFTNSTPNGVVNFVTKKPQFINSTEVRFTVGSYNFVKALLDTQYVISKSKGLAMRIISSYQDWNGRVDHQHAALTFVDPSFTWRPNDKIEFTAEYNHTVQKSPYATFFWAGAFNPRYLKDVTSPSAQLIGYMKSAYGLATDAQALDKINERWGYPKNGTITGTTSQGSVNNAFMTNWSNDIFGMTGLAPQYQSGSTIDWWRFSPRGDKMAQAGPDSNFDGDAQMADVSLTFSPIKNLSVRYHWLHMVNNTAFTRQLYTPDAGFRPDGRVIAMNWAGALSWTPHRYGTSDAQQLDANYAVEAFNMKHTFAVGYEKNHTKATIDNVTTDFRKGGNGFTIDSTGATVFAAGPVDYRDSNGNALPGGSSYFYYDPFGNSPQQGIYKVVSSGPVQTNLSIGNFVAQSFSYRGSALNNRLNVMAGMRHSKLINTGRSDNSPTFGAIFEVVKGFHVFASRSEMSTFTNALSIVGPGVVPADNQHLLENEKDKGYEYGIKTNFNDSEFSGTMSVYSDERNGYIQLDFVKSINDPRNQGSNITTTQAQSSINGGIQRAEGMEWDLTWTPNRNLQLIANYAWQYTAKIVSDKTLNPATPGALVNQNFKRRLIKSPKNRANFIGKYNFTSGGMQGTSIGGAMHLTDPYYVTAGPANWIIVPRMTVFDLFATYSTQFFNVPTNFQLNAINLTNNINDITRGNGLELRLTTGFKF